MIDRVLIEMVLSMMEQLPEDTEGASAHLVVLVGEDRYTVSYTPNAGGGGGKE